MHKSMEHELKCNSGFLMEKNSDMKINRLHSHDSVTPYLLFREF